MSDTPLRLVELIRGATLSQSTSFAELIPHLVGEELIDVDFVEGFWVLTLNKNASIVGFNSNSNSNSNSINSLPFFLHI